MYEFRPSRTNNKAQKLIVLFFVGAAALFLLSVPLEGLPFLWVIQLFAILLLVAAVFLVTRYMTKAFEYSISEGDLTVTEISGGGRRRIAVCRVSLSGIESARVIEGKDEGLRAIRRARKRIFDYRPDISPHKSILAVAREGGEEFLILFAYDEEFLSILRGSVDERNI